jgi:hypothetical protein
MSTGWTTTRGHAATASTPSALGERDAVVSGTTTPVRHADRESIFLSGKGTFASFIAAKAASLRRTTRCVRLACDLL